MDQLDYNSDRYNRAFKIVLKHYWRVTKLNWKTSIPGLLLPAIGSIFVFYIPPLALTKIVSLGVDHSGGFNSYIPYIALFAGSWLIGEMLWRIGMEFAIKAEIRAAEKLYKDGLSFLLKRDLSFFHDNFAGSLTKRTVAYASRFIDVADTVIFNVFSQIVPVIFAAIVLWIYSPWLVLVLFSWLLLTFAIVLPLIRKRRHLVTLRETAVTVVSGHVADVYGNIDAVRAYANEKAEEKRHRHYVKDLVKKTEHTWTFQNRRIDLIISPLYVLTNASGLTLSLFLAYKGHISFTSLIVVFAYYARVTVFMWEFNSIYRRLESALSDAAQYTELLLTEPTIHSLAKPNRITDPRGGIEFKDVHFQYEKDSNKLFTDFSLIIEPGEKIGLVGRSGGGKTSITKLLLRFSDIDSGSITIDGVDIRELSQEDLRALIAYVPQDPAMFHRTIHENIAYGKQDASREEVIEAAKKAHAHEFVNDLPNGYETLVGERGVKLSGGQRQRIAIARAILKDAPILLLDEATSALDSESEKLIQSALWILMEGKTAIVIAHRLSTIQKMDRIVVLEEGEIVEEGSHKELVQGDGIYSELWKHQSGGFLED